MMGAYDLAFNSIGKLIHIQSICHTDYDGGVPNCLHVKKIFCLLQPTTTEIETNNHNSEPSYHISQLCSPSHHLLWSTHTNLS